MDRLDRVLDSLRYEFTRNEFSVFWLFFFVELYVFLDRVSVPMMQSLPLLAACMFATARTCMILAAVPEHVFHPALAAIIIRIVFYACGVSFNMAITICSYIIACWLAYKCARAFFRRD